MSTVILTREEVLVEERRQAEYRERVNPGWRKQRQEHFKILFLKGPSKLSAAEILARAAKLRKEKEEGIRK